ncbi:polysulfide reductase NrfD [Oceanisphaera profunda]|uniref:Polysulfide reductase NrfD n=1 Tax=Oceanisphaera profunda TaxID=1416627 RepID=A0A1Y0D8T8_9GAMM|nr:NrfD/PsrC family molybdoenzyme membrane anchor subunit [Oceanisphaera profunda]ART83694.1 polysulfide reductase NrfD [Oceanisphaera profunda]
MPVIELLTTHADAPWLPWAVQYFFLIGLAATAALLLPLALIEGSSLHPWRWRLAFIMGISAVSGPVALLADLHQPLRFWHFYTQLTPSSWMWIGALILPIFVTLALVVSLSMLVTLLAPKQAWLKWWCELPLWPTGKVLHGLAWLTALSAVGILIYTGMEVMVVRSRALWDTAWLPVNFLLTAFLALFGLLLLLDILFPRVSAQILPLRRNMLLTLGALTAAMLLWALTGVMLGSPSWTEATRIFLNFSFWRDLLLVSLAGGILLWVLCWARRRSIVNRLDVIPALLAILCAWGFRWVVLMNVQTVPKYGAGLYHLSADLLGSAGIIVAGTIGLWLAMAAVVWALLDNMGVRHG